MSLRRTIDLATVDLPQPDFAHDAEGLAFGNVEADAAHGMHHIVTADGKLDFKIPHRQEDVEIATQRSVSGTGHQFTPVSAWICNPVTV